MYDARGIEGGDSSVRRDTAPCASNRSLRLTVAASLRRLGTKYASVVQLPVIGEQHFGLSVTSDREAQLTLQGAIDLDEPIQYSVGSDGKLEFTLSETTTRILGRLGTTLLHAGACLLLDSPIRCMTLPAPSWPCLPSRA